MKTSKPSAGFAPASVSRRQFLHTAALGTAAALGAAFHGQPTATAPIPAKGTGVILRTRDDDKRFLPGAQRLSVAALQKWEAMKFGLFIHFGMSTYVSAELPSGADPSTTYAPDKLNVDQWISIARDTGTKYAVLTTKHVAGHCLWPTKHNDYHVGTSGNKTDVVDAFVKACERRGVKPGFYYWAWDNHTRFGSLSPNVAPLPFGKNPSPTNRGSAYVTQAYLDFQWAQITSLEDHACGASMNWRGLRMRTPPCVLSVSRSLSPVMMTSACAANAVARTRSSSGSRQTRAGKGNGDTSRARRW